MIVGLGIPVKDSDRVFGVADIHIRRKRLRRWVSGYLAEQILVEGHREVGCGMW